MLAKRARVNKSSNVCLAMKYSGQFWRPLATYRNNIMGKRENIEFLGVENEDYF